MKTFLIALVASTIGGIFATLIMENFGSGIRKGGGVVLSGITSKGGG